MSYLCRVNLPAGWAGLCPSWRLRKEGSRWLHAATYPACLTTRPHQKGSCPLEGRVGSTYSWCQEGGWDRGSQLPSGAELQALPGCRCSGCALHKSSWQRKNALSPSRRPERQHPPEEGTFYKFAHGPCVLTGKGAVPGRGVSSLLTWSSSAEFSRISLQDSAGNPRGK